MSDEIRSETAAGILREERRRQGLSLDDVAVGTKISLHYLQAIEQEEWSRIPGEAYRKGFLRNYARFLGLEPKAVLGLYDAGAVEPQKEASAEDFAELLSSADRPGKKVYRFLLLLVLLLGGGGALLYLKMGAIPPFDAFTSPEHRVPRQETARPVPEPAAGLELPPEGGDTQRPVPPPSEEGTAGEIPEASVVEAPSPPEQKEGSFEPPTPSSSPPVEPLGQEAVVEPPVEEVPSATESAPPAAEGARESTAAPRESEREAPGAAGEQPREDSFQDFRGGVLRIQALAPTEVTVIIDERAPRVYTLLKGSALSWKVEKTLRLVLTDPDAVAASLAGETIDFDGRSEWSLGTRGEEGGR